MTHFTVFRQAFSRFQQRSEKSSHNGISAIGPRLLPHIATVSIISRAVAFGLMHHAEIDDD